MNRKINSFLYLVKAFVIYFLFAFFAFLMLMIFIDVLDSIRTWYSAGDFFFTYRFNRIKKGAFYVIFPALFFGVFVGMVNAWKEIKRRQLFHKLKKFKEIEDDTWDVDIK